MVLLYIWIAAQIILEMLPISSSTHLRLLEEWFKRKYSWDIADYFKQRNVALTDVYYFLHLTTLCVVSAFLWPLWTSWFLHPKIVLGVISANIITVCFFYFFKKYSISWPLIFGMCITAFSLIFTAPYKPGIALADMQYSMFIVLGFAQGIALLPGISRLAFTTAAGCCMGIPLLHSFIISWLIYVPIMLVAVVKSSINLYQTGTLAQLLNWRICLAMLVSGMISWLVLSQVAHLIVSNKWWLLGWYMIIPIGLWVLLSKKD